MSISRRWIHRVLIGMLLAGMTVAAAADEYYVVTDKKLLAALGAATDVSPDKIAVVIVIDDKGTPNYLFPKKPVEGNILPSSHEVGLLINLQPIAVAVTSKSPNCVWIVGAGGKYLLCL